MKRIGVFGMGCIASVLSKYLLETKRYELVFFNRSHRDQISIEFNNHKTEYSIDLASEIESVDELDWLIVCLKLYHYESALNSLRHLIKKNTKVAVFRNGLDLKNELIGFCDEENILETIIDCSVQKSQEGVYLQLREPKITLPNSQLSESFSLLFENTSVSVALINDFKKKQWEKLIESASIGAIQVLKKGPCLIFNDEQNLDILKDLIQDGVRVAVSEAIDLDHDFQERLIKKILDYPDNKGSSMLSDFLSNRQLEINAKIGAIIRAAHKNKIDIPVSLSIYEQIKKI